MPQMTTAPINYVEFPAKDIAATKAFFSAVFGWEFTDYGPDHTAFSAVTAGLDGGFYASEFRADSDVGGTLVVLKTDTLETVLAAVQAAGATICKPIFSFPGGRRFHFREPSGNELAVWSES